jgi:hypothetical protein
MTKSKLDEKSVLDLIDNSDDGFYCHFISLGDAYSFLIDSRLNIFRDNEGNWAIAAERLGYNPRSGGILLTVNYFGNCLQNLEVYNNRLSNGIYIDIFDSSFEETITGESLNTTATKWIVRSKEIPLSHDKKEYENAGIKLSEFGPNEIRVEEAARLAILKFHANFRAKDEELYRCLPKNLTKTLVLDEWYHKDYFISNNLRSEHLTDDDIKETYESAKNELNKRGIDFQTFKNSMLTQKIQQDKSNKEMFDNNRPSTYETWKMIAKVIVTGEVKHYRPKLKPNSHWSNHLDSGSL